MACVCMRERQVERERTERKHVCCEREKEKEDKEKNYACWEKGKEKQWLVLYACIHTYPHTHPHTYPHTYPHIPSPCSAPSNIMCLIECPAMRSMKMLCDGRSTCHTMGVATPRVRARNIARTSCVLYGCFVGGCCTCIVWVLYVCVLCQIVHSVSCIPQYTTINSPMKAHESKTQYIYKPTCLSLVTVSFASRSGCRYCLRKRCLMMAGRCKNTHSQTRCVINGKQCGDQCWQQACISGCIPLLHPVQANACQMQGWLVPPSPFPFNLTATLLHYAWLCAQTKSTSVCVDFASTLKQIRRGCHACNNTFSQAGGLHVRTPHTWVT